MLFVYRQIISDIPDSQHHAGPKLTQGWWCEQNAWNPSARLTIWAWSKLLKDTEVPPCCCFHGESRSVNSSPNTLKSISIVCKAAPETNDFKWSHLATITNMHLEGENEQCLTERMNFWLLAPGRKYSALGLWHSSITVMETKMDRTQYQLHSDVLQSVKKMKLRRRLLPQQDKDPKKTSKSTFSCYKKHKLELSYFPLTAIWAEHLHWEKTKTATWL